MTFLKSFDMRKNFDSVIGHFWNIVSMIIFKVSQYLLKCACVKFEYFPWYCPAQIPALTHKFHPPGSDPGLHAQF